MRNIKNILLAVLSIPCLLLPSIVSAQTTTLATRLSGKILLQVQARGEAWYVDPVLKARFYLAKGEDAYNIMRSRGLGIKHDELQAYLAASKFPVRLNGRILLDVQNHGEAYYVIPDKLTAVYLANGDDALRIMRTLGLGITNSDLAKIPLAAGSITPVNGGSYSTIEQQAYKLINDYRLSKGLPVLEWNDAVATIARIHSQNMANGQVPFGHQGFEDRVKNIQAVVNISSAAENVAASNETDLVNSVVNGWIQSQGHRENIENSAYNLSGMGVGSDGKGMYYFTQLFAHKI
jgi:uncharacterized protein YkwD